MVGKASIDGKDLYTEYGIGVEKISGHIDLLKPKQRVSHSWADEHGEDISLARAYFEPREIVLNLYIKVSTSSDFISKMKAFLAILSTAGLKKLALAHINKVYLVYFKDSGQFQMVSSWNSSRIIGRFSLTLVEPNPVNRQFSTDQTTPSQVTFTISCTKSITIWWGDGGNTTVLGNNQVATHTYASGKYTIVIYGDIDSISSLSNSANVSEIV